MARVETWKVIAAYTPLDEMEKPALGGTLHALGVEEAPSDRQWLAVGDWNDEEEDSPSARSYALLE